MGKPIFQYGWTCAGSMKICADRVQQPVVPAEAVTIGQFGGVAGRDERPHVAGRIPVCQFERRRPTVHPEGPQRRTLPDRDARTTRRQCRVHRHVRGQVTRPVGYRWSLPTGAETGEGTQWRPPVAAVAVVDGEGEPTPYRGD